MQAGYRWEIRAFLRGGKDEKGPKCSQPSRMLRSNSRCAAMAGDIVSKMAQPICNGNGKNGCVGKC